jgi:transcriptional regulator with XRE-family HTH domain
MTPGFADIGGAPAPLVALDPDESHEEVKASPDELRAEQVCAVVGERVRSIRRELGLTMAQYAEAAEVSIGMLSKIEHGRTAPSIATLGRLARAGNVPITSLFRGLEEEHDAVIVRAGEGREIIHSTSGKGRRYQDLGALRGPERRIEPLLITLATADEVFPLYQHPGVELLYILEGSMEYGYGTNRYLLGPGDTMQFHGEVAHGPTALVDLPVRFLSLKVYSTPAR